jgi:hypothetical protein
MISSQDIYKSVSVLLTISYKQTILVNVDTLDSQFATVEACNCNIVNWIVGVVGDIIFRQSLQLKHICIACWSRWNSKSALNGLLFVKITRNGIDKVVIFIGL